MQKLLWIGSPFFCDALRSCGWQAVEFYNFEEPRIFCWSELVRLAGFTPDVLVVADKSRPPFVLGVENFPCLTVFYAVDSHIHSWLPLYAQAFDLCLVSLRDHLPRFGGSFLPAERVVWSPPFAQDYIQPPAQPLPPAQRPYACLFVGNVSPETPKRAAFLAELGQRLPLLEGAPQLHSQHGNFRELFPQGRVLINQCEHGDLNFRVFEALACGGTLLTPRVGHGLETLFTDGEELLTYAPHDVDDALQAIDGLLHNAEKCQDMAEAGLAAVNAAHRARHRAASLTARLRALGPQAATLIRQRRERALAIREQCLKMPYLLWAEALENTLLQESYLAAAQGRYTADGIVE